MAVAWRQLPITRALARRSFDCGQGNLNEYFRRYSLKNHNDGTARTFVAVHHDDEHRILGYYTICPAHLAHKDAPRELQDQFPRYPMAGYRLARLAIAVHMQGRRLGSQLLLAAGKQALAAAQLGGGSLMFIDAKDENAANWYEGRGCIRLPDDPLRLVIRLETIARALDIEYPQPAVVAEVAAGR